MFKEPSSWELCTSLKPNKSYVGPGPSGVILLPEAASLERVERTDPEEDEEEGRTKSAVMSPDITEGPVRTEGSACLAALA